MAAISGAAAVLFTVNGASKVEEVYSGPPLEYYIQKFSKPELFEEVPVEAPAVSEIVVISEVESAPVVVETVEIVASCAESDPAPTVEETVEIVPSVAEEVSL